MKHIGLIFGAILLSALPAAAQVTGGAISVRDSSSGAVELNVGDATNHALRINCVTGCGGGSGGTSISDNGTFTQGTTTETPASGLYTTSYSAATAGKSTILRMHSGGQAYVNLDSVGTNALLTGNGSTGTGSLRVTIASDNTAFAVNAAESGTWTVQPGNTANTTPWLMKQGRSASGTLANVSSSATSVAVLAANTARLGATVYNDSAQPLFLKFGATASATSYTVRIDGGGFYEVPVWYTGQLDGIWSSANGAARVTEVQ